MILECDRCREHKHDQCQRTVRAFIEPDGPDTYMCECYCNTQRMARQDAERKVRQVVTAFEDRYGREALVALDLLPQDQSDD